MTKEKPVTIHVHTPFTLTLSDKSRQSFKKGRHLVSKDIASHWFTLAHAEASDREGNVPDDKDALISDLKASLLVMKETNDSLNAQIAAARTGGNGEKDAKESKSANGK